MGLSLFIGVVEVMAGIPRVPCTVFGMVQDSYGIPYLSNARITLCNSEATNAWQNINGLLNYGLNIQMLLNMDSGTGDRYAAYAVRAGEELQIIVEVDGVVQPLLEGATLTVPAAGSDIELNLTTGTDSDGDNLPDEWEYQMMAASYGMITNISQILPNDDFDGDGASNMHEYLSGSFAFLDYDLFAIEDLERSKDGWFIFRFLSVPGKSYSVEVTDSLSGASVWSIGAFSLNAEGSSTLTAVVGDGYYRTVYIEATADQQFMRIVVK